MGHSNRSTVQGWKKAGGIPWYQQKAVLAVAKENQIDLTWDDFRPEDEAAE